jgi:hypothetical protein
MAHDVFISHARKDINVAKAICEKLESAQIKCWLAERDISAGEDWTVATRKAIGSSRVVVLLLSENANAATHLEREVAHAFYTNRTILPVRLTEAPPSRDFLFYLGNVRWLDASKEPVEQSLDALVASVKEMLKKPKIFADALLSPGAAAEGNTAGLSDSRLGGFHASHYRTMEIVKRVSIVTILLSVVWLIWYVYSERKSEWFPPEDQQHPTRSAPAAARSSAPQGAGAASPPKSEYTYSRFGLWVEAEHGPTPEKTPGTVDQPAPAVKTASPAPNEKGELAMLESEPKPSAEINPSPSAAPLLTPSVPASGESKASIPPTPLAELTPSVEPSPPAEISSPGELTHEAKATPTAEATTSTESSSPAELGPTAKPTPAVEPSPEAKATPIAEATTSTESSSPAELGPTAKPTPAKSTPAFETAPLAKSEPSTKSTPGNESNGPAAEAGDGSGPALEQQSLKDLVLSYMQTVASDDDSAQERFFARRVNFFGKGTLSISMVRASMERYRQEWPVRDWEPQGEPEFPKDLHASHPELYEVLQPFAWTVVNGSHRKEGTAVLYVRIRRDDQGQLHIIHLELRHRGENDSP